MELNELQVDVRKFYERAREDKWGYMAFRKIHELAGRAAPLSIPEVLEFPVQTLRYVDLIEGLDGHYRLAAVESLAGLDPVKTGGTVLLAMATQVFLPHLPVNHPAYPQTQDLLGCLGEYLLGNAAAESYIRTAFLYRSQYGTSYTSKGTDPQYEQLFEAMPEEGLDFVIGMGFWGLSRHWLSFGRFLATQGLAWGTLDTLEEDIKNTEFVSDDEDANLEAQESALLLIDRQREELTLISLEDQDLILVGLLDGLLPMLCYESATQA